MTEETQDAAREISVLEKVALLATRNLTQEQIGKRLNLSQPTVSRRLKEAIKSGLIKESAPVWCDSVARREAVDRMLQPTEELLSVLQSQSAAARNLREVRILENASLSPARESGGDFGERVVRALLDQPLPKRGLIGVAWGGMLLQCAESAERRLKQPLRGYPDLHFLPICGDPPEVDENPMRSAANIAARLETAITGNTDFALSFGSVAACIPAGFENERADTIRDFFRTVPGYRRIFGASKSTKGGEIQNLNGVLTSLGTNDRNVRWLNAAAAAAKVDPGELADSTPGNIGGFFVTHKDATDTQKDLVNLVNKRWTGIRIDHLKRCAKAAAEDDSRLGVVMLAGRDGAQSDIAIECVRQGLATRLYVSPITGLKILDELAPDRNGTQ